MKIQYSNNYECNRQINLIEKTIGQHKLQLYRISSACVRQGFVKELKETLFKLLYRKTIEFTNLRLNTVNVKWSIVIN